MVNDELFGTNQVQSMAKTIIDQLYLNFDYVTITTKGTKYFIIIDSILLSIVFNDILLINFIYLLTISQFTPIVFCSFGIIENSQQ
jgi:hypothetical protein